MKRICLMALIVLFGGVCQVYGAQFGPMKAASHAKGFSLGAGYTYLPDTWEIGPAAAENVNVTQNQAFVQVGVSGARLDLFARAGITDFKADGGYRFSASRIEADPAPYGEAGASLVFYDNKTLVVGPFVQGSYYGLIEAEGRGSGVDTISLVTYTGQETVSIEKLWAAAGGLKFQLDIEGALLYFGPAYYYSAADYESVFKTTAPTAGLTSIASGDIETARKFGGFVGVFWQLDDHYQLELEAQVKQDVSLGGVLSYRF